MIFSTTHRWNFDDISPSPPFRILITSKSNCPKYVTQLDSNTSLMSSKVDCTHKLNSCLCCMAPWFTYTRIFMYIDLDHDMMIDKNLYMAK